MHPVNSSNTSASPFFYRRLLPLSLWRLAITGFLILVCASGIDTLSKYPGRVDLRPEEAVEVLITLQCPIWTLVISDHLMIFDG